MEQIRPMPIRILPLVFVFQPDRTTLCTLVFLSSRQWPRPRPRPQRPNPVNFPAIFSTAILLPIEVRLTLNTGGRTEPLPSHSQRMLISLQIERDIALSTQALRTKSHNSPNREARAVSVTLITAGCLSRFSTEIAKNASLSEGSRPITSTWYIFWISVSTTVGATKMPVPT